MRNIAGNDLSTTKFLVILKVFGIRLILGNRDYMTSCIQHPITLNIATPKTMGWKYYIESTEGSNGNLRHKGKRQINAQNLVDNFIHLNSFLHHDNSSLR